MGWYFRRTHSDQITMYYLNNEYLNVIQHLLDIMKIYLEMSQNREQLISAVQQGWEAIYQLLIHH